jgi:hypothetical protein
MLKVEFSLLGSDAPHGREIHNCLGLTAEYKVSEAVG